MQAPLPKPHLRVALIQITPEATIANNLQKMAAWVAQAAADGAELILLQEMFYYRGPHGPADMQRVAEAVPGPTSQFLADLARQHRIWLHGGSLFEVNPDAPHHPYNCSLVFDPQGSCIGKYRKINLFALQQVSGNQSVSELDYQTPGDPESITTVATPWGGLGLSICFDLRFPALYQHQVRQQAARMLAVPSAFLFKTGADHWEVLLRARAIETQCYVLAPNCLSHDFPACYGRSMVVDPWGNVIARMPDREGYVIADLDFDLQAEIRAKLPVLGAE